MVAVADVWSPWQNLRKFCRSLVATLPDSCPRHTPETFAIFNAEGHGMAETMWRRDLVDNRNCPLNKKLELSESLASMNLELSSSLEIELLP